MATIKAFEAGFLDLKGFYFLGDDYRYRIEDEAKRRFLELLKNRFNSGVKHKGKTWKWDTVILNKTQGLGQFLLEKTDSFDFMYPSPRLERSDSRDLRKRILELFQSDARNLGIGKSTIHCLRTRARGFIQGLSGYSK